MKNGGQNYKMNNNYKGIILAGGSGTRLHPITLGISKQLLPIYDKPMIYYPLSTLMLAGIKEILIISTEQDIPFYERLLGDGSNFGVAISYCIQPSPDGIAQAFILGEKFIGNSNVCLVLGDNIFYGENLPKRLESAVSSNHGATIFGYHVKNPEEFGVVDFDTNKKVTSIIEKPKKPNSNFAVTGLYFYDNEVIDKKKKLKPSLRGELEITAVNNIYLERGNLSVELLGSGFAWLDTGSHESLIEAGQFVQTIQNRQGLKLACIEEIAYQNGWISTQKLIKNGKKLSKTDYGKYILSLVKQ